MKQPVYSTYLLIKNQMCLQVPEPVLPPWVSTTASSSSASTPAGASAASAAVAGSTEHVYAMPARVIRTSGESLVEGHDPRSVGSLVSLDSSSTTAATPGVNSPWRTSSTASTATRTLCDSKESVPNDSSSPDPVISRIRRDFERKQEFLRTTNLPNYLGSPTHPQTASSRTAAAGEALDSDPEFYVKQQQQQQPLIVQPEERQRPPVYFGDRFPVGVSPNQQVHPPPPQHSSVRRPEGHGAVDDQAEQGQFHLYGLQLGKSRLKVIYIVT